CLRAAPERRRRRSTPTTPGRRGRARSAPGSNRRRRRRKTPRRPRRPGPPLSSLRRSEALRRPPSAPSRRPPSHPPPPPPPPDARPEPAVRAGVVRDDLRPGIGLERRRRDDVTRELDRKPERRALSQLLGHLAAHEHRVRPAAEVAQDAELVLDLRTARDQDE